jgi:hypothetical protein
MSESSARTSRRRDGTVDIEMRHGLDLATARAWRRPGGRLYLLWGGFVHEPNQQALELDRRFRRLAAEAADRSLEDVAA